MANHEIRKDYSEELRKVESTDPVHFDFMNGIFDRLINNDAFLKENVDKINTKFDEEGLTWNELRGMR